MPCTEAMANKPFELKDKSFQLRIKDKCDKKQKSINSKRIWCYYLKSALISKYSQSKNYDDE